MLSLMLGVKKVENSVSMGNFWQRPLNYFSSTSNFALLEYVELSR